MSAGRILYVEDNFDNRILIKRVLEAEGYTVIEAENGVSGLALARTCNPDLVLMDINLPDVDGYDCTARLRTLEALRGVPILALTANVLEGDRQKALDAGCDGYIAKPIDVDGLPAQLAAHIGKKKANGAGPAEASPPPAKAGPVAGAPRPALTRVGESAPTAEARGESAQRTKDESQGTP